MKKELHFSIFILAFVLLSMQLQNKPEKGSTFHSIGTQISDTVQGQLETAEKLRKLMDQGKYNAAIELFSEQQQKNIRKLKKDKAKFKNWCELWTFDPAKFDRYTTLIKSGKAPFVYEDDTWKIDEK